MKKYIETPEFLGKLEELLKIQQEHMEKMNVPANAIDELLETYSLFYKTGGLYIQMMIIQDMLKQGITPPA